MSLDERGRGTRGLGDLDLFRESGRNLIAHQLLTMNLVLLATGTTLSSYFALVRLTGGGSKNEFADKTESRDIMVLAKRTPEA